MAALSSLAGCVSSNPHAGADPRLTSHSVREDRSADIRKGSRPVEAVATAYTGDRAISSGSGKLSKTFIGGGVHLKAHDGVPDYQRNGTLRRPR